MVLRPAVNVEVRPSGYAVLTICSEPVNSMTTQLWQELADNVGWLAASLALFSSCYFAWCWVIW